MGIAASHLSASELQAVALDLLTEPKPEGENVWGHCPWHAENTPGGAFYYTPGRDWGYCHSCGNSGDIIDIYAAVHGQESREACKHFLQRYCPQATHASGRSEPAQSPAMPRDRQAWQPKSATTPAQVWLEHATKMVAWAHDQLLKNSQVLDYLAGRGIPHDAVRNYGLGLIPQDVWRERRAWGLDPKYRDDGREKKLWIPAGIVIPSYVDGILHRVRVRRWQGEPRYYWVPGSGNQTMLLRRRATSPLPDAAAVVETELDALALHHVAGDLVHVVALGSSSAKPRMPVSDFLQRCVCILVSADFDDAGITAWDWWEQAFPQSQLWPSPVGKDVGDAAEAGVPLREWLISGLPPAWRVGPSASGWFEQGGGNDLEHEDVSLETDQVPGFNRGLMEQDKPCDLLSATVREFQGLIAANPVQIVAKEGRLGLSEPPAWARDHWDTAKRISDLLFFDDDVAGWVIGHAQEMGGVVHAGNIQTG